ncbi:MAG: serine hydrolase domain-containing protein [Armatimonadota bacterium]
MTKLQQLLSDAITDGTFPGAAYFVRRNGIIEEGYIGRQTYCPDSKPVDKHTLWDLASVSKVVSTTTLTMLAVQNSKLDLDWPVAKIIPEFGVNDKQGITFRNLMVHNSGLIAFRAYYKTCRTREEVLRQIFDEKLTYFTGSKTIYSDLSMILMDEALNRVLGGSLDQLFRKRIAEPLGLHQTGYFTLGVPTMIGPTDRQNCAPTERTEDWRKTMRRLRHGDLGSIKLYGNDPEFIQAEVHDPTATAMGGVAGHAGLFATLKDLARFTENYCAAKPLVINSSLRTDFTKRQASTSTRALGWDTKSETGSSAGTKLGPTTYGHTGYTGTSIWIDPVTGNFGLLLTNRVHPTSDNVKLLGFRGRFYDAAF